MTQCIFRFLSVLMVASCISPLIAQTFNGQGGLPVPPGAPGQTVGITTSLATVNGIGILGTGCSYIDNVTIDFTHTWVGDIAIFLIAPSGEVLEFTSGNGGSGDNFQITEFTDNAAQFITAGTPPYNGAFRPEGRQTNTSPPFSNANPLGTFTFENTFTGVNADGDWTLLINDYVLIDVGTLNAWSITFATGGGPAPSVTLGPDVTICPGQSTTLTANVTPSADSYLWSTGATSASITVSPNVNTTYSVTVTNNDCIDSDTIQVIVNPNGVTANAGNDISICQGNSTTLTGSGGSAGATYNWSSGQTGSTISVSPSATTTYTLTVTDNGCADTDQVVVTVNPTPNANAGNDVSICQGQSTTLTASGGNQNNQYQWSTGQTGATITVTPSNTTTYTVTVTINGCPATDNVLVTVNPTPTVNAGADVQICSGESTTLTASGSGGTYTWSTGQTGASITVSPTSTTTYTVTATQNGCTATDNVTVTVGNITAGITPNQSICEGASVTLTASGGTNYMWSTGQTGSSIIVTPSMSTTYAVTVTQGTCSDDVSTTVTVNPIPAVTISEDQEICAGQSVTLTASGGTSYSWNNGQNTSSITVSPPSTSLYTVTVTQSGCSASASVNVAVNPSPNAFAGNDESICVGESVTLTATGLAGPGTYAWSNGESTASISVTPSSTTIYTVTITNEFNCFDTDAVTVTVTPTPIAEAGQPVNICDGQSTTLTASGGTQNNQYQWSSGQTGATITVSPSSTTTYTVTVSINGCVDTDDVTVTVNDPPTVDLGPDIEICAGGSATLTASGSGGTYMWSTGQTGASITVSPSSTTTYTVTATQNGCTATDNIVVTIGDINVNITPDQAICDGESVTLIASGGITYTWNTGQTGASISVSPTSTTTYTVTVSQGTCSDEASTTVTVDPVPEVEVSDDQEICSGESVTLTASGGTSYLWNSGQTTSSITVSPPSTSTFSVTVTQGGCSLSENINVDVNAAPIAFAGTDENICEGESVILIASGLQGPGTYEWSNGETTSSITVSPSVTTTYTVTITNEFDCSDSDAVIVNVSAAPVANAGPDQDLCAGISTMLVATGGTIPSSYQWSTGQTGSTITVSPTTDTDYTVTVTLGSCISVDEVTINVLPSPVADAGPNQKICMGETTQLTASGGGTYEWSIGGNTATISVSPVMTTNYIVMVTNSLGCTTQDNVTVMVYPLPIADAGTDQTICAGETSLLTGLGGGSYLWSTSESTQSISVQPSATTSYQLTVTDAQGCSDSDVATVIVNPLPFANAGTNVFIITGGSATLNATGGGTYLWSTGETTSQIMVSPSITTTYSVTVTLNGCSDVDDVTVFVNEAPSIDLGPDAVICEGQTATLDGTISGPFDMSYVWSTGATTSSITVSPGITTTYSVTATDNISGVATSDTLIVTVVTLPVGNPAIQGSASICEGDLSTYTVQPVSGATTYTWTLNGGGTIISGQGSTSIEVDWNSAVSGQVQLLVSNSCGSLPASSLNVAIGTAPLLQSPITGPASPCAQGSSQYSIPQVNGADTYQWTVPGNAIITTGQGTTGITIDWNGSAGGDVCVIASNACGNSSPVCMTINTTSTPVINAGDDQENCGLEADLIGSGTGSWTFVSGPGTATILNASISTTSVEVSTDGAYIFNFSTSQNGCTASDEVVLVFNENPSIINEINDCNDVNTGYTVSFTISGGQSPFLVNSTTFNGVTFTSGLITAGAPYSFIVTDANGCVSQEISGQIDCSCTTQAGTMDPGLIEACQDAQVNANYLGGETLDGNDKLAFILHDGNIPGGIIAWNNSPQFDFVAPMLTETTYFISAVVGNEGTGGLPQLNDPCLAISQGTPVVFHGFPTASAGEDKILECNPAEVNLDGSSSTTGVDVVYSWTTPDGFIKGPSNIPVITATETGMYILTVSNASAGCSSSDTAVVISSPSTPQFEIVVIPPVCYGDCSGIIEIQTSESGLLYEFGDGTFTSTNNFNNACSGLVTVSVMDTSGCVVSSTVTITEPPLLQVDLGPDQNITLGDSAILTAEVSFGVIQFNWFDASACLICPQITVSPSSTTVYEIEVADMNGCIASDEVVVEVDNSIVIAKNVFVPTVFTPNNDGINDVFIVQGTEDLVSIKSFEIFDRWGNKVFELNNFLPGTEGWDGVYRGSPATPGVYVYLIRAVFTDGDEELLNGDITVIR